jgi:hypothetical protein
MPFKECLRLDHDQSFTPIEEPGEQNHEGACASVRASRPHLAFLKHSELVAQEQVLCDDGGAGGKEQADEREQATFYKSLQDLLRPSERSDLFFAEDTLSLDLSSSSFYVPLQVSADLCLYVAIQRAPTCSIASSALLIVARIPSHDFNCAASAVRSVVFIGQMPFNTQ